MIKCSFQNIIFKTKNKPKNCSTTANTSLFISDFLGRKPDSDCCV